MPRVRPAPVGFAFGSAPGPKRRGCHPPESSWTVEGFSVAHPHPAAMSLSCLDGGRGPPPRGPNPRKLERSDVEWRPTEAHENRHRSLGILRQRQRHRDVDLDLGTGRVVHNADNFLLDRRLAARINFARLSNFPFNLGNFLGNAAVNFAFEQFDDFRAPLLPPHFGSVDRLYPSQSSESPAVRGTDWPSPRRSWQRSGILRCCFGPAAAW